MRFISVARLIDMATLGFVGLAMAGCNPNGGGALGGAGGDMHRGSSGGRGGGGNAGGEGGGNGAGIVVYLDASLSAGDANGGPTTNVTPTADANCGAQTTNTSRVPVDVLLVFDCSTSMGGIWDSFKTAVMQALSTTKDIRWGLKLYPSPGFLPTCGVTDGVEVSVSASSTTAIEAQLSKTNPVGFTPTGKAIQVATTYLQGVNDNSNKAILLATDGEPNCDADVPATVKAINAAKNAGFPVYVVGIGASVGNLDDFAQAGGTDKYYPAPSTQELATALESISKAVASCTFALTSTPPNIDNIAVYLDKNLVPKDAGNGWNFDTILQSVTLTGSYCEKISTSMASTVQVLFGCPGYIAPPVIL